MTHLFTLTFFERPCGISTDQCLNGPKLFSSELAAYRDLWKYVSVRISDLGLDWDVLESPLTELGVEQEAITDVQAFVAGLPADSKESIHLCRWYFDFMDGDGTEAAFYIERQRIPTTGSKKELTQGLRNILEKGGISYVDEEGLADLGWHLDMCDTGEYIDISLWPFWSDNTKLTDPVIDGRLTFDVKTNDFYLVFGLNSGEGMEQPVQVKSESIDDDLANSIDLAIMSTLQSPLGSYCSANPDSKTELVEKLARLQEFLVAA